MKTVIVDIDGTLFNLKYDIRKVAKRNQKLDLNKLIKNKPYKNIINFVNKLKNFGYSIIIITGRPETLRDFTELQLKKANIKYDKLIMRPLKIPISEIPKFKKSIIENYDVLYFIDDDLKIIKLINQHYPQIITILAKNGKFVKFF